LTNATWTKNYKKNPTQSSIRHQAPQPLEQRQLDVWGHEEARRSKEHKRIDRGRVAVL
jgi:hypothetical protein